jgi:DNA polymerase I-like protein with 3'-5' exonuclease and polymerase domains
MQLKGMKSKLCVQIHDEIILLSPNDEVKQASEMLQYYMEKNKVTATMLVPMIAEPVITNVSLAEAK